MIRAASNGTEKVEQVMQWDDVRQKSRDWLRFFGNFAPTVNASAREMKGYIQSEGGDDGRTYITSGELREVAAAFLEAADWLDKRASGQPPEPTNKSNAGSPQPWSPLYTAEQLSAHAAAEVAAERERCAKVCDDEARIREEAGNTWPEESPERSRCYAGARAAMNCAKGVRNGEAVEPLQTDLSGNKSKEEGASNGRP